MQWLKRLYVQSIHALGKVPPLSIVAKGADQAGPYGWRRWAASTVAIYDTERMVALDVPWWNVAATQEIELFLASRADARVFEFGAGASTAWLARRAREVVSVEHDPRFISGFKKLLAPFPNVTLLERSITDGPAPYVNAIGEAGGLFDLVVVDGRHRAACLAAARPFLKPGGLVLFDDSGRKRYRQAIETSGLIETHHHGRSFCVPYPDHTSVLRGRD